MQQVVHDGKIVRRQVPNYVAIMLEKPQVHSSRIVVVELAECSLFEQFFYFSDSAREQKGVVHHDLEILLLRKVDQFFRLSNIAGKWLFHKHVLAILQRCLGQLIVRPDRCDNRDSIDVRRLYELTTITVDRKVRVGRLNALARGRTLIADTDDLAAFQGSQIADDVRPPVTVADHSKLKHKNSPEKRFYGLAGAVAGDHCLWSLYKNLQIEPGGTIARVTQIESNHVVKSDAAPSLHLPQTGNPWLRLKQATAMPGRISVNLVWHRRTRPDQ